MSMIILRLIYVPLILLGFPAVAIMLVGAGQPKWMLGLLLLVAVAVSFAAERAAPYNEDWNRPHGDSRRDVLHFLVNEMSNVLSVLALPLVVAVVPHFDIWPSSWPLWQQVLLAVFVADFGITITHYVSHKLDWLWRFHAVHHSVKRMYGFNGLMKHPLHQAVELVVGTAPLVLSGIPQDVAFLLAFCVAAQLLLQHSNVKVIIGPLRYVLALSPVHRFHHLKWPGEGDVNFGFFTTIWDRVLGTAAYDPVRRFDSGDLGIGDEPDFPETYVAQIIRPFMRRRAASVEPADRQKATSN